MGIAIVALTGIMRVNTCSRWQGAGCTDLHQDARAFDEAPSPSSSSAAVVVLVLASTLMLLSGEGSRLALGIRLPGDR